MLIDICRMLGPEAIAQVDLGTREHRNRSLQSLSVQAAEVMATMLSRAGVDAADGSTTTCALRRADGSQVPLNLASRPPLADLGHHAAHPARLTCRHASCSCVTASRPGTRSAGGRAEPTRRCPSWARIRPGAAAVESVVHHGSFVAVATSTLHRARRTGELIATHVPIDLLDGVRGPDRTVGGGVGRPDARRDRGAVSRTGWPSIADRPGYEPDDEIIERATGRCEVIAGSHPDAQRARRVARRCDQCART